MSIDARKLRAWWFSKQGLDGSLKGKDPAAVLEKAGWARSVGGANPYLTLFARAGIGREAADKAAAALEICELPSARGCTYVVPSSEFALALTAGQGFGDEAEIQTAVKFLGVTEKEIERLMDKVVAALEKHGPLDPKDLKEKLGDAVRNLGEAGKKKGVTTTLPLALGKLQSTGQIRRAPVNGRLDQQRYSYARWIPSPLAGNRLDGEQAAVELARRYFRWIGPASVKEFQWFSGFSVKGCKAAIESVGAAPVGPQTDLLILPEEQESFGRFNPPAKPVYSLVSSLDSMFLLRREIASMLDDKDANTHLPVDRSTKPLGGLQDLPSNAILDRGRIVGLWEYRPSDATLVWTSFVQPDRQMKAEIDKMQDYIREQLGDARTFSLDSPESRKPRIEALQKMNKV